MLPVPDIVFAFVNVGGGFVKVLSPKSIGVDWYAFWMFSSSVVDSLVLLSSCISIPLLPKS
jgi:hypothetical protein